MRFIGDVHGKFSAYIAVAEEADESIQVGDFGVGFGIDAPVISLNHCFIRGNHDNPEDCNTHVSYLGEYGMYKGIFFAGGGYSIDRAMRVEGRDWWPNEQLTWKQMANAGHIYVKERPNIVVSHMCPMSVEDEVFNFRYGYRNPTHAFLDSLLLWHKPKLWVFGHYHIGVDQVIDGCRYVCLPELAHIDINLDDYLLAI